MSSTKTVELRYDTGVRDNSYERGNIGELNGFNKIESPFPESIEDMVSSIYCINETTVKDEDIKRLIEYALYRVCKESSTALREYCKDKEKSDVMPDLRMLLASETTYVNIKKIKFKK